MSKPSGIPAEAEPTFGERIARRLRLAPEGLPLILGPLALGILLLALGARWVGALALLAGLGMAGFFRDPERHPPDSEEAVVLAGADGRVLDISEATPPGSADERCKRVSIFMSVLDVHINRAPVGGEVSGVRYFPGGFRAAFTEASSERNERNVIAITDREQRRHTLVQVAGILARRIVCRIRAGDQLRAGQRLGLIMFGSRFDHYFPAVYRVTINRGQKVRAGETVIAKLGE